MEPTSKKSISNLKSDELEALHVWLSEFDLQLRCGTKKLNREFSDGVLMAELLKTQFPSLVEMHSYTSCSSVQSKMDNWRMLNRKVLRKLDLHLTNEVVEKLARAEPNCIEEVLHRVMKSVKITTGKELRSDTQGCGDQKSSPKTKNTQSESEVKIRSQDDEIRALKLNIKLLQDELEHKNREIQTLQSQVAMKTHKSSSIAALRNSLNKLF